MTPPSTPAPPRSARQPARPRRPAQRPPQPQLPCPPLDHDQEPRRPRPRLPCRRYDHRERPGPADLQAVPYAARSDPCSGRADDHRTGQRRANHANHADRDYPHHHDDYADDHDSGWGRRWRDQPDRRWRVRRAVADLAVRQARQRRRDRLLQPLLPPGHHRESVPARSPRLCVRSRASGVRCLGVQRPPRSSRRARRDSGGRASPSWPHGSAACRTTGSRSPRRAGRVAHTVRATVVQAVDPQGRRPPPPTASTVTATLRLSIPTGVETVVRFQLRNEPVS